MSEPFRNTDCALNVIAAREKAYDLRDLHDRLNRTDNQAAMIDHLSGR